MNNKVTSQNYSSTCLIPSILSFTKKKHIAAQLRRYPRRLDEHYVKYESGYARRKGFPLNFNGQTPLARDIGFSRNSLVPRQTRRPMYSWGIKFSSQFARKELSESSRRGTSPPPRSDPCPPFRPSIRFKPPSDLPFSYFFFRPLRMHMILRMHHCARACTSYAAIRLRFRD